MIWVRRFFAVLLGVAFLPVFVVALLLLRINATFLSPEFYVEQLRRADLFTFTYDVAIPAALEEAAKGDPQLAKHIAKWKGDIVAPVREVFPPAWLQEQVEAAITAGLPYFTGDADAFTVRVAVAERVRALGKALKDEARQEKVYRFLFDDVIAPEAEKRLKTQDFPLGITLDSKEVVAAAQEVVPRPWVSELVAHGVDELVPYLTGEAEHFQLRVRLTDRLEAARAPAKRLLQGSGVYDVLSRDEFAREVDKQLNAFSPLPFGVVIGSQQVVPVLQQVFPQEWVQAQVEAALDRVVRYLTNEQEATLVKLPVKDRVKVALEGEDAPVKRFLREIGTYDRVYREGVVPALVDLAAGAAGGSAAAPDRPVFTLPITPKVNLVVTRGEVENSLREGLQAVPPGWLQGQVESAIDALAPYLTGEAQHFSASLSVGQLVEQVLPTIQRLVEQKLAREYESLPLCTAQQALSVATTGLAKELPLCRPPGFTMAQVQQALGVPGPAITQEQAERLCGCNLDLVLKPMSLQDLLRLLGLDLGREVSQTVLKVLPQTYTYTDADLRKTLGPENQELLDKALRWTREGYTYTDADLRGALGPQDRTTLDQVLKATRQGFTYTDADLREDLKDAGPEAQENFDRALEWIREGFSFTEKDLRKAASGPGGAGSLRELDSARQVLGQARQLAFLLYVVPALLLVVIGLLGGRSWRGRAAWAAVWLGLGAAAVYIASGPVYKNVAQPLLDDQITNMTRGATGVQRIVVEKAVSVARSVASDFVSGLERQALLLLAVAGMALALAIVWPRKPRAAPPPQPVAPPGPPLAKGTEQGARPPA
ncbi:MAG: hypothetical protein HY535_03860 [Chloroflexi bacterium]|nr:hypothetical protein [Chloroflexota bacterium]